MNRAYGPRGYVPPGEIPKPVGEWAEMALSKCAMYEIYLADFPDIVLVLHNLRQELLGEKLETGTPPIGPGPWDLKGLRELLSAKYRKQAEHAERRMFKECREAR